MPVLSPSGQDGVSIFTVMALSDILTRATRQSTGDERRESAIQPVMRQPRRDRADTP